MKILRKIFTLCLLLIIPMFCFTACSGSGAVAPKNVKYDGVNITWDSVSKADYYTVSIDGGAEKRVNTNSYAYNSGDKNFTASIKSYAGEESAGTEVSFTYLTKITEITVNEDGSLSWNSVANATGYRISVNGEILSKDLTDTYFKPEVGTSRIKIKPVVSGNDSYYSYWSIDKTITILSAPSQIKYNGTELTWIGNSSKYEVKINGVANEVYGNSYVYNSNTQDFNVSIKALGNHTSTFDSDSVSETYHFLEQVTGLKMEDGILNWTPVSGAVGYKIKINNVEKGVVDSPKYDKLDSGVSLSISVMSYNSPTNYFSVWSSPIQVYILETPTTSWNSDLELDGESNNNFIWNSVNGAVGYQVEIEKDGKTTTSQFSTAHMSYASAYNEVGTYKVRVKAVAEAGTDYYDSRFSKDIIVERLAAPKASSNFISSDEKDLTKGFTVNYNAVPSATGYQLYKDGAIRYGKFSNVVSISENDIVDKNISSEQQINYYIRSMGGTKIVSGITYVTLPCLTKDALSFKITVQAMPTSLEMSGFSATWSNVSSSNGYVVKYGSALTLANSNQFDLSTLKAGDNFISVCAKGNGGAILASNYTSEITVNRLSAPKNIKISYGAGNGQLLFEGVSNAKSYQVFLDQSNQALPETAYSNMYQFINEAGTTLRMVSVANYYNNLKTIYYMTSESSLTQQFIRLAAPTFSDASFATDKELIWNASSNINTSEYTPTYEVYKDNIKQTGGNANGTQFNIAYLEGGKNHTFTIKAVGNDSKYLDSKMSVSKTIFKLAKPTLNISIENSNYYWQGVSNASSYVIEIDGKIVYTTPHISNQTYTFTPKFETIGNHIVKLYAVGDGYNTINSDMYSYTQVVKGLNSPEILYNYSSDVFVKNGTIDVKITTPSSNCIKYQYEIAGETIVSNELTCSKIIENAGVYSIRVKALGGNFDNNFNYYIDSQYAGGNSGYELNILAFPTLSSFSMNSDGAIKWAIISNAIGYEYEIAFDNDDYSNVKVTSTASINPIDDYSAYKTIKIKVRARGNGENIITSDWVEFVWNNPNL